LKGIVTKNYTPFAPNFPSIKEWCRKNSVVVYG